MGARRPGISRVGFRRVGAAGGGTGSIEELTSTDGSIEITNPNGPITDLASNAVLTVDVVSPLSGDGSPGAPLNMPAATSIAPGYMTAAQAAQVAASTGLAGWYANRAAEMKAANLALTRFEPIYGFSQLAYSGVPASGVTSNANVEGGCWLIPSAVQSYLGQTIVKAPKSGDWAFCFGFASVAPTAGAHNTAIGLLNPAGNVYLQCATDFASDPTHFILRVGGPGGLVDTVSTQVVDPAAFYNGMLVGHAGSAKLYINNAIVATDNALTQFQDVSCSIAGFNSVTSELSFLRCIYGYIDPLPA